LVTSAKPTLIEIARALTEPTPLSAAVAEAYGRLRGAVAALGVTLRPLGREPVFGPLGRDLARAEALLTGGRSPTTTATATASVAAEITEPQRRELARLDLAIRDHHGAALTALLAGGPRTRLDPGRFGAWLRAVEAERTLGETGRQDETRWIAPALHFQELDLEVPVVEPVVATIVANLLRNAVEAVRSAAESRIAVRVTAERDVTGRRQVILLVADSSVETITLDQIERRDGRRGLGIVRDLVRGWGGHVLIREEPAPFSKAIGVAFPAAVVASGAP
jgi:signal transduction histidine kinase